MKRGHVFCICISSLVGKWQTSALIRQLVNSDSLEQHRGIYTQLVTDEVDPAEDQLSAAERCALARGDEIDDPRDIYGVLEVSKPARTADAGAIFDPMRLPAVPPSQS